MVKINEKFTNRRKAVKWLNWYLRLYDPNGYDTSLRIYGSRGNWEVVGTRSGSA